MRSVCQLTAGLQYYFYNASVGMRKSFHGLEGLVVEQFGRYLIGDEVFVFPGKNGRIIKMLHREGREVTCKSELLLFA